MARPAPVAVLTAAIAAASASAADLTRMPLPAGARVDRDLAYVPGGHERQALDLYWAPDGPPRPLIVWIHGGGFSGGDKSDGIALDPLAWGYALASINYRLSGDATFPAQIEDCKAAVRWLRADAERYNLDPDRVGAWGSSAGGHLAALLGTSGGVDAFEVGPHLDRSSRVSAVCEFFGPTDFTRIVEQTPTFSKIDRSRPDVPEWKLLGGTLDERRELAVLAGPISHVSPDDPPFLIFHGDRDDLVPFAQSEVFHEALRAAGVESEFVPFPGLGHDRMPIWERERPRIRAFFDRHLMPDHAEAPGEPAR